MSKKSVAILFNHHLSAVQILELQKNWAASNFIYPPNELQELWGKLEPSQPDVEILAKPFIEWLTTQTQADDLLLVMGEFGVSFYIVSWAIMNNLTPIHTTAIRSITHESQEGTATTIERTIVHQQFRKYKNYTNMSNTKTMAGSKSFSYFIVCESPVHAGGGSEIGYIDNVIQREKVTGFPMITGESHRGAIREHFREKKVLETELLFGSEKDGDKAGLISNGECNLLFFPVRSFNGTFAWITCPLALTQFERRMQLHDQSFNLPFNPAGLAKDTIWCNSEALDVQTEKTVLEGLILNRKPLSVNDKPNFEIYFKDLVLKEHSLTSLFQNRCCIVHDDIFTMLVKNHTDVRTRIKIDPATGTASGTGLFKVEYLPEMSILHTIMLCNAEFAKNGKTEDEIGIIFEKNRPGYYRLGGDKGVGKGILKLI